MKKLDDVWKNIDIGTNIKTLWFNAPKDAIKYLEDLLKDLSCDIPIANEDDEEIDKNELLNLFDDYRKSQEHKLYFRLVESNTDYLVIDIECWELHNDDYDSHADVLTISKYCGNEMKEEEKFIVRLYDGFDNEWMDITKSIIREEAQKIWDKETLNGTKNTCFNDIDYYKIFPADTRMFFSNKEGRQNE